MGKHFSCQKFSKNKINDFFTLKDWTTDLFDFAQLVHVTLVGFHAVLGQVQVGRVLAQLLLVLRHFLDHLRQISHALLVSLRHSLRVYELLQVLSHIPEINSRYGKQACCWVNSQLKEKFNQPIHITQKSDVFAGSPIITFS